MPLEPGFARYVLARVAQPSESWPDSLMALLVIAGALRLSATSASSGQHSSNPSALDRTGALCGRHVSSDIWARGGFFGAGAMLLGAALALLLSCPQARIGAVPTRSGNLAFATLLIGPGERFSVSP